MGGRLAQYTGPGEQNVGEFTQPLPNGATHLMVTLPRPVLVLASVSQGTPSLPGPCPGQTLHQSSPDLRGKHKTVRIRCPEELPTAPSLPRRFTQSCSGESLGLVARRLVTLLFRWQPVLCQAWSVSTQISLDAASALWKLNLFKPI